MPQTVHDKRLAVVESRHGRDPTFPAGEIAPATLQKIYGGTLARHLACLKRLHESRDIRNENLTSLAVFHLVEMGFLARDEHGVMRVTPRGASVLADCDRQHHNTGRRTVRDAGADLKLTLARVR